MKNEEITKIIEKAARDNLVYLDLSGKDLIELPPEIEHLTNLISLNLSHNRLVVLPDEIGRLINLQNLNVESNQLNTLSPAIGQLTNLTMLGLNSNRLVTLPSEIGRLKNLTNLPLGGNQLTALPSEIGQLSNLKMLYLKNNLINSLPVEIGRLTNLTTLDLRFNRLSELPPEIGQLANLTTFDLGGNQLITLPAEIGCLFKLTTLDIRNNQLVKLPVEISQLINLISLDLNGNKLAELPREIAHLTNLTILKLNANLLTKLPKEIGFLTNLYTLGINRNKLTVLPPEIGKLINLSEFDLHLNKLTALPPEIGGLIKLATLSIHSNKLTTLPSEIGQLLNLTTFNLSDNRISTLPVEIGQLINLISLDLRKNLLSIPPEILNKTDEPTNIIKYYLQYQSGPQKPLNEAKLLLVGQGSVGKTSLVKRLMNDEFDHHENKTEGINIKQWPITVNNQSIRLNVWDLGGQEIMHATHQFFLTKRSLYLLVLDARLGEEENRLEYWLKIIQSFGGDSSIIIVGNKIDQHQLDIDRRGLQAKYKSIKAFVETSCQSGQGLNDLKEVIYKEVGTLAHINDQLLTTWFNVKTRLEKIKKNYIAWPDYVRICKAEKITDPIGQRTLIGFLHDLGIVLNFQDDPRLVDTNILNPIWVTNGVYKILNSNILFQNKGILKLEMLHQILDKKEYPEDKPLFIMDMMRKFELCFTFESSEDRKFFIPDLLSKEEPYTGDWRKALAFQYHYNILPSSIISRFIVRMNAHIYQNTYWRTGVVLSFEGNKALVKADIEDRKIFIRISGPEATRRNLLAIIRSQFDAIHKTIAKIEAVEKVPLPNYPNIVVDYKHLLELEALGETSLIPEGLRERVLVEQLLDGIEPERSRRVRKDIRLREEGSVPRPTRPQPEPATQLEEETDDKLGQIRKQLNLDSQKYANRIFLLNFVILVTVAIGLALLTYKLGWDTMEPWTYFIGIGAVIGSYAYFALTQQEFSPKAIYEQIVEKKKRELYKKFGLN